MRVALVISSLGPGGAERAASTMANYWARKGWDLSILTLSGKANPPFYDLDPLVAHVPLGLAWVSQNPLQALTSNVRRVWVLRSAIARIRPDAVISFMDTTSVLAVLATRGLGIPVIASERTNPDYGSVGGMWLRLRDFAYGLADVVVTQTEGARNSLPATVRAHCAVIPNPVRAMLPVTSTEGVVVPRPAIAAMGRLSEEKRFDLLLAAFARLKTVHPAWRLVILGEGTLRRGLETLVAESGIADRVLLPGLVRNPETVLRQADLFVMSSRHEGFPNALLEAMACGLPAVATDCPYGPRDIIRDGVDGLLVPSGDVLALSEAMNRLMSDEGERRRLGQKATEVISRFGLERVMGTWEEILQRAASLR